MVQDFLAAGPDWQPVVGDWDADGADEVGLARLVGSQMEFHLDTDGDIDAEWLVTLPAQAGAVALSGTWSCIRLVNSLVGARAK
mgnify:CR=1 FL=1